MENGKGRERQQENQSPTDLAGKGMRVCRIVSEKGGRSSRSAIGEFSLVSERLWEGMN